MTHMCLYHVPAKAWYTILEPSGDQEGALSESGFVVSRRKSERYACVDAASTFEYGATIAINEKQKRQIVIVTNIFFIFSLSIATSSEI